MMTTVNSNVGLPVAFADLEYLIADWALESEEARFKKLHSVSLDELRSFYQTMLKRLPDILMFLKQCQLTDMSPQARKLFDLAMTFVETSHPLDLGWKDTDFPGAYKWQAFEFRTVSCATRAKA
ncbi:MAG: hypothetical protein RLZZ596_835 [Pseudomonadota bacterium]|jgi:hypothetical protein